ncbi:DUF1826 domain-containing protein [Pseudomonas citronellolis]|uniref:DUF1826 domain-containing protein n=1 Tax=Pseudomonas citronellolis TaxID=53408 RepID=UPI0023E4716B|nr:DUF1826 domain-containing protein [Pseudomonas citronellolis]MDF3933083.1 DUF1826 domain-containing protein [Pseudomonas citronellolis]
MLAVQSLPAPRQVFGEDPQVLAEVLRDGVNLAVWQRQLYPEVAAFAASLLQGEALYSQQVSLELDAAGRAPQLHGLFPGSPDGRLFVNDLAWLVEAFACLTGARQVGLRLRALERAMCPRFHVDHLALRLVTSYAGCASEWLEEGALPRSALGEAEPPCVHSLEVGDVGLFKGEKWGGNEGAGIVHRSPCPAPGSRRLLLTLDWL